VQTVLPDWWLVHPGTAADVVELAADPPTHFFCAD